MAGKTQKRNTARKRTTATRTTGRAAERRTRRTATQPEKTTRPRQTGKSEEIIRKRPVKHPSEYVPPKSVTFVLDAPAGSDVAIAGSFNNWQPQTMTKGQDGLWRINLHLVPGTYLYKFRIDAEWREDPSNPRKSPNEHGGYNSVCDVM
jgi:1,4-alpha-glucan branching enzyme